MTRTLTFAGPGDAPGLAAFLTRQLRWDRSAVVRLRAADGVLAAFTRPARFEVLAVRSGRLTGAAAPPAAGTATGGAPGPADPAGDSPDLPTGAGPAPEGAVEELDTTVSAGQLLDAVDESTGSVAVPPAVTGPPWAGVLPPRGDWRRLAEPETTEVRTAASEVVDEFRRRTERLTPAERTRGTLDGLAEEIWDRTLPGTPLPLRTVHAAHALGFLAADGPVAVLAAGAWLRLRTAHGSIVVRRAGRPGLSLTPTGG